jgi:uncharacterized repeat protein (TIGR01451 family)
MLNLNSDAGTTKAELKQSYVSVVHNALGRFAAGNDATRMGHPTTAIQLNPAGSGAPPLLSVTLTKVAGNGPPFLVGQNVVYTVTVTRTGPGQRDCVLTDVLSAKLTLLSANASSGAAVADLPTNTVTWTGTLNDATPSATITITATILATGATFNGVAVDVDANGDAVVDGTVQTFATFSASTPP